MKASFKPLGLVAAVAAVTAGYAGTANATVASNALGDLALVPYYTVQDDWTTGVHITNTTDYTQVVKFRMRRGSDSSDALDFNIIMSPKDVWVANINDDESGNIILTTTDNSCTAPELTGGTVTMPGTYRVGAEEGYIEVIGMAQIAQSSYIGYSSTHVAGVPIDCAGVRSNFLVNSVTNYNTTTQSSSITGNSGVNTYMDTSNGLKVSYFIRDAASGIEFGNSAVHIQDFMTVPTMTHQQYGLTSFVQLGISSLNGFDWPDLNGGGLNTLTGASGMGRDRYDMVIRADLGASAIMNDWSYNAANGVSTDWVVTIPGQYTMTDFLARLAFLGGDLTSVWDYRDIPVTAVTTVYDREEDEATPGGLVISPSPAPDTTLLRTEVNVIEWGNETIVPVFNSDYDISIDPSTAGIDNPFGWASLAINSKPGGQAVCDLVLLFATGGPGVGTDCTAVTNLRAPVIGFVGWKRNFDNPDKNYGRIVEHSYVTS